MASKFFSLSLPAGEAFVLETEVGNGGSFTVLVDGGENGKDLCAAIDALVVKGGLSSRNLNVVVCTHSDSDHSKGMPDFARRWLRCGGSIGEFWLPGGWSAAFPELLTDPDAFDEKLVQGALEVQRALAELGKTDKGDLLRGLELDKPPTVRLNLSARIDRDLRHLWRRLRPDVLPTALTLDLGMTANDKDSRAKTVRSALGLPADYRRVRRRSALKKKTVLFALTEAGGKGSKPLVGAVDKTVDRIKEIAKAAVAASIPIRWFDFDAFERTRVASGGIPGLLVPMGSCEVTKSPLVSAAVMYLSLRLTEQNVESLTFLRPQTDLEPAVIFLGDSRLAFGVEDPVEDFPLSGVQPPNRPVLITAAHHGSRVNDRAYDVLGAWLGKALLERCLFVRNGGMWKQRLNRFFRLPQRICARCVQLCHPAGGSKEQMNDWRQLVDVETRSRNWAYPRHLTRCGTPQRPNAVVY
ncbi:MAG: hypothetical protein HQL42_20195 [Alphaproteobacteria bacterium]|nr:hypothetical protein [Alphaproteobacteria bacterium]